MKRTPLVVVVLAAACAVLAGDSSGSASSYPSPLVLPSTASSVTGSRTPVTIRSVADRLTLGAPARVTVLHAARYLRARVTSTRRANVVATMTGRGLGTHRWRFTLGVGATAVQLRLPLKIRRPGVYTMRWNATAGTKRAARVTQVTLRR